VLKPKGRFDDSRIAGCEHNIKKFNGRRLQRVFDEKLLFDLDGILTDIYRKDNSFLVFTRR
jgi:hypothetical protein